MRLRSTFALVSIATVVAMLYSTSGARAATSADTTVTFTVSAGELAITAPDALDLGTAAPGGTVTNQLESVTVVDSRGLAAATWTATVAATDFTVAGNTIVNDNATYWSGPSTASDPTTGFTPGQATAANAVALDQTRTAFSFSGSGGNTVTWAPTLSVTIPLTAVAGTYTGTLTHSVAP